MSVASWRARRASHPVALVGAAVTVLITLVVSGVATVIPVSAASSTSVAAAARPKRIVSLSPTATEMLFAIGAGRQVIAVDDKSNYPKSAPRTKLSGFQPNVESITGYKPDLVILSDGGVADALRQLGVRALVQLPATTVADSYRQLTALGSVTGNRSGATRVVASMKSELGRLAASVPKRSPQPTVYYELDNTFFSASSHSFIGQILAMAGLKNIADQADQSGSGYPQLSQEYIISANPTYIFLADTKCCAQSPAAVASRPGWSQLTAVTGRHVVALDDDIASRWGPRTVQLFRTVVAEVQGTQAKAA
ncbi:MAG TPA: ABC transporter substrate-binding protein [Acidimicrobiia bacterium]|nr:ABC transporter substrate-binding protein [Acidimicrobiia bacterium]